MKIARIRISWPDDGSLRDDDRRDSNLDSEFGVAESALARKISFSRAASSLVREFWYLIGQFVPSLTSHTLINRNEFVEHVEYADSHNDYPLLNSTEFD